MSDGFKNRSRFSTVIHILGSQSGDEGDGACTGDEELVVEVDIEFLGKPSQGLKLA